MLLSSSCDLILAGNVLPMTVRTRFAPSPTGYLHIGGVRTALFNWLFAKRHGGQFILRIDDTDASRHVEEAVSLIVNGFRWVGIDWDEGPEVGGDHGPYFQSQRRPSHEAAIVRLIEAGTAYPCLESQASLDAAREAARAAKRPFVHRGVNRDLPPQEALTIFQEKKPAVRFKVPNGAVTAIDDYVRGHVEWQTDLLGDFTIARAGGEPLYNLASIVDDINMGITHIIRAEEHLSNTHPQVLIAQALGAALPRFAHVPFVAAPGSKQKLSKRNPPPGVMVALDEYEKAGYLPSAIINALARLGWSLDDKTEIMSLETMIREFSLERITSSPAGLDPDKMFWMQDHYMRSLSPAERVEKMIPFLQSAGVVQQPATAEERRMVTMIDAASADRLKLLSDIVRYGQFFFQEELDFDAKAVKNLTKEGVPEVLEKLADAVARVEPFDVANVEAAVHQVAEETELGGKINHVLRAAITGCAVGPGVHDCVVILGKDRTVSRLRSTQSKLMSGALGK